MKPVRTGLAALSLMCFALPWVVVSCQSQPVYHASGLKLMTGLDYTTSLGNSHVGPSPLVVAAGLCILAALVLGLIRAADGRAMALISSLLSAAAAACLLLLPKVSAFENLFGTVTFTYGYYVTVGLVIACFIVNGVVAIRPAVAPERSSGP